MAINPEVIAKAAEVLKTGAEMFLDNPKAQKTVLGTYSDGKPRSIIDAIHGETISPKDRLLITKRLEESRKKKKKNKKKGKKKKNQSGLSKAIEQSTGFYIEF